MKDGMLSGKKPSLPELVVYVVLLAAQLIAGMMLMTSLINTGIVQSWIIALVIGGLVTVWIFCALKLLILKKTMLVTKIICSLTLIVVTAMSGFAMQYSNAFNGFLDKIAAKKSASEESVEIVSEDEETEISKKKVTEEPFILYISGSDSHYEVSDPEARSDVNIIVVVNPKQQRILLASIPRDTYVQLHGTAGLMDKLTHAGLGMYYSPDMSKLTLEDYLGIEIDYTVKVSFDTVVGVVDELGGIEIYSDRALWLDAWSEDEPNKHCRFVVGTQWVDGDCALRFARERMSYKTGDKHRGENQQEVLTGIINKFVSSRDYILKLPAILEIVGDSFTTTFNREEIAEFIRFQLTEQIKWQIDTVNLDGVGDLLPTYTYPNMNLWVMLADEGSLQEVKDTIRDYLTVEDSGGD